MMPLAHYFEVFCPPSSSIHARCATWDEASSAAQEYAKDGKDYVVYECRIVYRTNPDNIETAAVPAIVTVS